MTEENIVLYKAVPEDLESLVSLCSAVVRELPQCGWTEHYPDRALLKEDLASGHLWKVLREGQIVSLSKISPYEEWAEGEDEMDTKHLVRSLKKPCVMGRFCVLPALGGHGFGRRVIAAAFKKAESLGYDGVFFEAVSGNAIARHLYGKLGFPVTGELDAYGLHFLTYEVPFARWDEEKALQKQERNEA